MPQASPKGIPMEPLGFVISIFLKFGILLKKVPTIKLRYLLRINRATAQYWSKWQSFYRTPAGLNLYNNSKPDLLFYHFYELRNANAVQLNHPCFQQKR